MMTRTILKYVVGRPLQGLVYALLFTAAYTLGWGAWLWQKR